MANFGALFVSTAATLGETIRVIDAGRLGLALVSDADGRLVGTVTDGDIRRGLLRGFSLDVSIEQVMHREPIVAPIGTPRAELLRTMQAREIVHIPLVDGDARVLGLEVLPDLLGAVEMKENVVVVLAGGRGTRLAPLTVYTPKPLLPLGDRSILEVLIEQIAGCGFHRFLLAVNYHADQIEQRLGDGSALRVDISYLREDRPLGTAAPLRTARAHLTRPFIVVNGDLLTKLNFEHFLAFHAQAGNTVTMGVKEYTHQIPYGVVCMSSGEVVAVEEKPLQSWFVNAGIYVLDPTALDFIPDDGPFDMPELIRDILARGRRAGAFPIHEYWRDIGAYSDYQLANVDYLKLFPRAGRSAV